MAPSALTLLQLLFAAPVVGLHAPQPLQAIVSADGAVDFAKLSPPPAAALNRSAAAAPAPAALFGEAAVLTTEGSTRRARRRAAGRLAADAMMDCRACDDGVVNYPWLLRTSFLGRATTPILVVWVMVLVWLLNSTAQEYFVPPLAYWSRLLRMREEVAGATLVALGNGAPDVFAFSTAARDDLPLALDELLGAMMCDLCVAGGAVLMAVACFRSRNEKDGGEPSGKGSSRGSYVESIGGLAVTLAYLACILPRGTVALGQAACMPLIYGAYLVVLILRLGPGEAMPEKSDDPPLEGPAPPLPGLGRPEGAGPLALTGWALAWPTYAIRWVIIPPADKYWDRTRRTVSSMAPLGVVLFCAATGSGGLERITSTPAWAVAAASSAAFSVALYVCSDDGPQVPAFYWALMLLSKVSSVCVLSVVAGELTAVVESLGLVNGVPKLWLATTVIAWGNSLGDVATGIAMVQMGQVRVALTAIFAGPLFNVLCGAGLGMANAASSNGGQVAVWGAGVGQLDTVLHLVFLSGAGAVLACALSCGSHSHRWPGMLFALYAGFLACVLSVERRDV